MTEIDPREFYAPRRDVQRPPEQDPPLTIRVESRELRDTPGARRAIHVRVDGPTCWLVIDGDRIGTWLNHDDVRDWHISAELNVACAYRWHTAYPPERQEAPQSAERGDLDVDAFRTHATTRCCGGTGLAAHASVPLPGPQLHRPADTSGDDLMTAAERALRLVNEQARVVARTVQGDHYASGRVIAYQAAPTLLIELDNGERISWVAHLVEADVSGEGS